ncbi:MAG TPA: hypothetical protein VGD94_09535 [Vicinamibacterales bacterium]
MISPTLLMCLFFSGFVAPPAQDCLHSSSPAPEQQARKRAALSATRQVNTLQANGALRKGRAYLTQLEMGEAYAEFVKTRPNAPALVFERSGEILPGWQLTFDLTETGYWFMIRDTTDPCGFAYISNENGVIYTAEPIR